MTKRRTREERSVTYQEYETKVLALRSLGISSNFIARWGKKRGHNFSNGTILCMLQRGNVPRKDIADTIDEIYRRLHD